MSMRRPVGRIADRCHWFTCARAKADVMSMNLRWLALVLVSVLLIIAAAVAAFAGVRVSGQRPGQGPTREFQQQVLQVLHERFPDRTFVADKDDPDTILSQQAISGSASPMSGRSSSSPAAATPRNAS